MSPEKITIIEGPPPFPEQPEERWVYELASTFHMEDHFPARIALRSFNGPSLRERCYAAWHAGDHVNLHYRNQNGLEDTALIIAAQSVEFEEGDDVLLLWVMMTALQVNALIPSNDDFAE